MEYVWVVMVEKHIEPFEGYIVDSIWDSEEKANIRCREVNNKFKYPFVEKYEVK